MPDETDERIPLWTRLLDAETQPLLDALRDEDAPSATLVQRLRRDWDAELVRAAIELSRARRRAAARFENAERLVADVAGVEQATSPRVASYKAERFAALQPARIFDLCCGIGADAMALQAVAPVIAVDRDPLRVWMAGRNAGCATRVADVSELDLRGEVFHLDPARRSATTRRWRYEDYEPGPTVIAALLDRNPDGAVKLGPGVQIEDLPDLDRREVEIINEDGTLVAAMLWSGRLARCPGQRTATRLPDGLHMSGAVEPVPLTDEAAFERILYAADPAVERSGLLGLLARTHGLAEPAPGLGLLTGDAPVESPWLRAFHVETQMPWRIKSVRAWLAEHGAGVVTVKTRGGAVDPDQAHRELRGTGARPFTVFVLRLDRAVRAVITTPVM